MAELVDCTGLENRHTGNGIWGSNPVLTTKYKTMLDKYEIQEGKIYHCIDYANEIFEPVKIIENNLITGDIAFVVVSTNDAFYFSGQGGFEIIS